MFWTYRSDEGSNKIAKEVHTAHERPSELQFNPLKYKYRLFKNMNMSGYMSQAQQNPFARQPSEISAWALIYFLTEAGSPWGNEQRQEMCDDIIHTWEQQGSYIYLEEKYIMKIYLHFLKLPA